jgi:hypothetical protein
MYLNVADTLLEATNALNFINDDSRFPITGSNAKTGVPEPDKTKTEIWFSVDDIYHLTDGRFGFPTVPADKLSGEGVSLEEKELWYATFNIVLVEDAGHLIPASEETEE